MNEIIEDRWLIAGKCYREQRRMREYIARTCGTIRLGPSTWYGRKTRWN